MVNFEIMAVVFLFVTNGQLWLQVGLEFTSVVFLNDITVEEGRCLNV